VTRPAFNCGRILADRAQDDQRIWVLDGDLADSDGAEPFARAHPDRFIMAGIAEQAMVTMAAGMSTCGMRPWVFSFAAFLCYRGYDQIRVSVAQTGLPVTLVGSHSGGCGGINGKSHLALNDIAIMATLPHVEVWAPADSGDTELAVRAILSANRPAYIRYPREPLPDLNGVSAVCRWLGPQAEYAMISCGYGTALALRAQERLADAGIPVGIVHCARVHPLPSDQLRELLSTVSRSWVVEDHSRRGGLAALLTEAGLHTQEVFAWPPDWPGDFGPAEKLLSLHRLHPTQIAERIASDRLNRPPSHGQLR